MALIKKKKELDCHAWTDLSAGLLCIPKTREGIYIEHWPMEILMIHNYSMKTLFVWWLVDLVVLVNNEPKVGMSRWDLITCKIGWYPGRIAMKLINWSVKWSDDGMMLGAAAFVCGVVILSQSPKWVLELSARYLQVWSNTENDRVHEFFIFFTSNELKWDSKECNKFYLEESKHCPMALDWEWCELH